MQIVAEHLEQLSLLGLFMKAALEERLDALERAHPRGDIAIESGGMAVTISFTHEQALIREGIHGKPRARLTGDLGALAKIAQGRFVTPLLTRRIRISGDPLALLPLARTFTS